MNPVIHENLVEEFWLSAKLHKEGGSGKGTIIARVQDIEIVISEAVIREVMAFTNKPTDPVALEKGVIKGVLSEMGYEGIYPMLQKKLLIPYWRYIAHVFMMCMSGNKGTFDMLNKEQSSAFNQGGKYKFEGLHTLKKFGQFAKMEDVDAAEASEIPNVFVEEEHDVEVVSSKPSYEDVYVVKLPEYEDVLTGEEPDMDFDFEMETLPVENDPPEQVNLLTTENLEALLEHVKRTPRKRRRDPRPGVVIRESETEPVSVTQIQTTTAEPTEPSPHIKESIVGSSSHTEDLDYDSFLDGEKEIRDDKGKNVLPEDEPIDIVKLQSRVFELEQDSLSHTLLIQELKTENELKDKKIKDLETNMGHLSAIVLDLKQKLQDKFKGEFTDESSPSTAAEPVPEISQADFDELARSREEGLRKYFARDTRFKQHVKKGFSDMTLAQSIKTKKKTKSLGNPIDIDIFEVRWPATNWMKKVPILPDFPEGVWDSFKLWAFNEQTYGVVINCGEVEYTFYDSIDLICLSQKDIKSLNNQEMKVDQDHLEDALEFFVYARVILKNEAWSGGKGDSSTLTIKCGEFDESAKEKSAEETQN
ncbi:hypothetical protein R6Q59_013468 [Mikania micrantha]